MSSRKNNKKRQTDISSFFGKPAARSSSTPSKKKATLSSSSPTSATRLRSTVTPIVRPKAGRQPRAHNINAHSVDVNISEESEVIQPGFQPTESNCSTPNHNAATRKRPLLSATDEKGPEIPGRRSKRIRRVVSISDDEDDEVTAVEQLEEAQISQLSIGDTSMSDVPECTAAVDLDVMSCAPRTAEPPKSSRKPLDLPAEIEKVRIRTREKLADFSLRNANSVDDGGEWCAKNIWSTDIRDAFKLRPGEEGYDNTTLYIPTSAFRSMTPFQVQYWTMKMKNYDVLLFVKKGRFYELHAQDADVIHKELGLRYSKFRGDMHCVGIPERNFNRHASRMLSRGYKVGRVEQTETANGKDKRSASCIGRSLVRILTQATVVDDAMLRDHSPRYVFALIENEIQKQGDESSSDRVDVGLCYVDTACGAVTFNAYSDDFRRTETERLLSVLRPQEVLIGRQGISKVTSKLLRLSVDRCGGQVLELFDDGMPKMSTHWLSTYLNTEDKASILENTVKFIATYPLIVTAFGAVAKYFEGLMIDREIFSLGNFIFQTGTGTSKPQNEEAALHGYFTKESEQKNAIVNKIPDSVRMDASALASLEILTSSANDSEKGSLLSVINHANTPRGRRLLRKWLSAPLVRSEEIEDRLNAVDALLEIDSMEDGQVMKSICKNLASAKDIERALPRLHAQVVGDQRAVMFEDANKRNVKDFVKILRALECTLDAAEEASAALETINCKSTRLSWVVQRGGGIPTDTRRHLNHFFNDAFDFTVAESEGDIVPNIDSAPDYYECKESVGFVECELEAELSDIKTQLRIPSAKFCHRGTEKYQLELEKRHLGKSLPAEFELVSQTKIAKRFYTPALKRLIKKLELAIEAFEEAGKQVARKIISKFIRHFSVWSSLSKSTAELDALIGLARASNGDGSGPMCRPKILPNSHPAPLFHAKKLRHPVLSRNSDSFIPNDVLLGECEPNMAILTGPNAGGKSTLSRQVAVCALLAQVGCYVTAEALTFRPFEDVFVRMGANDDIARGQSTFMVEMQDVSNILNNATSHSLVIADEVGRGTSTHDGYALAYGALVHLATKSRCIGIFSTHYTMLGRDIATECDEEGKRNVGVYEMAASVNELRKEVTFLYKFQKGISSGSRGICCARLAGIPSAVADKAEVAAAEFEQALSKRLDSGTLRSIVCASTDDSSLIRLLESI